MPQKKVSLVVGLGNPGKTYAATRHNFGFMVLDKVADSFSIPLGKKKFNAMMGRGFIENVDVILAKPMAFMNRSGGPVHKITQYFNISCKDILVVHDDIDLAFGTLRIKQKGGSGGHNGIESLIESLGSNDFSRLRIGIGHGIGSSEKDIDVANYVLSKFSYNEKKNLDQIITKAQDAIITILCKGIKYTMNCFNNKKIMFDTNLMNS
ncbi:MAG: aminoacyl-tRNA hydrolase [Desulfobacterales bacterium]|uniref:Peptidyl-tRNA hydrolase n=1 Tax=Candidatus Desulfaltia bathyphila TaxID=2841697 RepID=A0A8J6N5G1_9BACT|nr:aminoacyl-tRNA hydrolase [Candidatus Desulfaltia bathyphila]MBL7195438.1 aminoacyl-tRNA hydrolase [Desulfobacterales bacterium]MBL7207032.1 aminoacyl-tRNA hydrolase [Desulfobacterales bacterium]